MDTVAQEDTAGQEDTVGTGRHRWTQLDNRTQPDRRTQLESVFDLNVPSLVVDHPDRSSFKTFLNISN